MLIFDSVFGEFWYSVVTFLVFSHTLKLFLQLVDVSEWSKSDNTSNVRLAFNQNWRPGVTVSSLIIQRVNKSHNGIFQCIPSNSEAKQIKVHVLKGMYIDKQIKLAKSLLDKFLKSRRLLVTCQSATIFTLLFFLDDSKPAAIQTTNNQKASSRGSRTSWRNCLQLLFIFSFHFNLLLSSFIYSI